MKNLLLEHKCLGVYKVLTTLKLKFTPCFLYQTYREYVKLAEPLPLAYVNKLQSLLRGQLNRYRYIFEKNRLPYRVAYITLVIVLTKTLPFWYLTSKHCHSNTIYIYLYIRLFIYIVQ